MRAQTTLDFAIGMSIFLLAVAFVVSFVPGMLQPFDANGGEDVVSADRVASHISRRLLTAAVDPFVLDVSCTTSFFGLSGDPPESSPSDCRFDGTTLRDRLGLADDANLNVRLEGEDADGDGSPDVLCNDGNDNVGEAGAQSCSTRFEAGETPPDDAGSVVVARRVVSIQDREATLLVRMW